MRSSHEYAQNNAQQFHDQLIDLLKIPSVSTDPAYKDDVLRAAEWVAADMRRIGLQEVAILPTGGHPVVYGEWLGAGDDAPTVLIYGHYDVQPAEMADGWDHDPFDPVVKDGRIIARGATDDKGQVMIQLKAAESMLAGGDCPVNLKYLIEGEEEIGSPNLSAFIHENKDKLQADVCVVSDTGIKAIDQPAIVYGLRGMVTMEMIVTGPKRDMHSGGVGGMIHNPAQAVAEIVAQLHKPDGTVNVPGFYEDVVTLSAEEREKLKLSDVTPAEWAAIMGDLPDWGEAAFTKIERAGIRPTLEINGIYGGYAGEGFKTVLPAKAGAKISCRLVPDQDPEKIFAQVRDFIQSIAPPTVRLELRYYDSGKPALTDIDHPAVQAAAAAYGAYWEKAPIYMRGGGTIPVVSEFQDILGLPVVLLGFGLPDAGAHGPNENFVLEMYDKGVATVITYMRELAGS